MPVHWFVNATVLNRLKVGLGNAAITPAPGNSVDGQGLPAQLVIGTNLLTPNSQTGVLATFPLLYPSFSYAGRIAQLLGTPFSVVASNGGTAALAEIRDHSGNTIINGLTVGISSQNPDIVIASTTVTGGGTMTCSGGSLTE